MHVVPHNQLLIAPPPLPAAPAIDPSGGLLDSKAGTFVEGNVGDLCSLLGIVGAGVIAINQRSAGREILGMRIVMGSMLAGATDTLIQARNVVRDDGAGAKKRGNERSTWGTVAYAATGVVPAVSVAAIRGLHRHPNRREVAALGLLALNTAVLGYELVTRLPKIARGDEDLSGYGSLAASFGGFVVARHLLRR